MKEQNTVQKWEYKLLQFDVVNDENPFEWDKYVNELAANGWELFEQQCDRYGYGVQHYNCYFKRPLINLLDEEK